MTVKERVDEVLEYYDYALVKKGEEGSENVVVVKSDVTPQMIFRYLTIVYGADRVSKTKKGVKVLG